MFNRCGSQEEITQTCEWDEINSKLNTVLSRYLENEEQVIKLKEDLFAEYWQNQQQHINDIIEPKEDPDAHKK